MIIEFIAKMGVYTGWSFTVLAGGPVPSDSGKITNIAVHSCENLYGSSFGQSHPNFYEAYLQPFGSFLDKVYRLLILIVSL
jgi:hypothetical protein